MPKKLNIKVDIEAEELRKKLNIKNGVDGKDGKDGKDAVVDVESLALEASKLSVERIKPIIPTIEQIEQDIPKLGQPIRDSLELLQDDERLDKSAIKGIEDYDEIAKLAREPKVIKNYNGGSGVRNFINLDDTPSTYSGQAGKFPKVNVGETGLEFADVPTPTTPSLQEVTDVGATTTTQSTFSGGIITNEVKASSSAGLNLKSNSGTDVALFGAGGGSNGTFYGGVNFDTATADTIASFGASKTLTSLSTSTYPSLTELSYVKGVTSAIQTQLDGKQASGTYVTGATDSTLTLTGTTLGLNLGNANTWTGQQTFKSSAVGTPTTIIQALASQTADLLQMKDSAGNVRMGFSTNKSQLFLGDTSGDSSQGLMYMVDVTHSFKPGIKMIKYTWGAGLDIALSTASPIILAAGGSTFTSYTTTDTGTYFSNAFTRGASFVVRNDNDSYGTQGFYASAFNNNSAPSVSGATKRAVVYGVAGTAQNNATGNGGAGLRSFSASANIDGVRADVLSGQTAPIFRARLVNSENDVNMTSAVDFFRIESGGSIWNRLTTTQQQWEYDASNYANITVNNVGSTTFDAVGSGASFTFSDPVTVPAFTATGAISITDGANKNVGVSGAMTAGTITISNTRVTANSRIFLTHATLGGTQGILSVGTITAGTSFVINSSSVLDTGTVNWIIIN